MNQNLLKPCVAGVIGTFALILIGVGVIFNNTSGAEVGLLGVAPAGLISGRFLIKETK